jgi:hypothetical protein
MSEKYTKRRYKTNIKEKKRVREDERIPRAARSGDVSLRFLSLSLFER